MAIIIDENTEAIVQGITGGQGRFHTKAMKDYGTNIVAGVTPGKGGNAVEDISVYDSISEVPQEINASIIFVPAPFAKDAALEAIDFGLNPVVIITERIPIHDSIQIMKKAETKGIDVIGPNTPGIISPEKSKMGVMPAHVFTQGIVGLISRSGTLTYEIANNLSRAGLGQSTTIGLGGDPVVGLSFVDVLKKFEADEETKAVVLVGEIGGNAEEIAAKYIRDNFSKPVVAYIAGRTAPPGKRMGHAGAIVSGGMGTAESKIKALTEAGVSVAELPSDVVKILHENIS
ncbi:MAG: succinate--CoA ligase subunit alpha [Methanomassiliicoccales archaeon]|nr:MAG: succinate--CoA ligase subunit alpha [Methanomassiliicoccales archaeon]